MVLKPPGASLPSDHLASSFNNRSLWAMLSSRYSQEKLQSIPEQRFINGITNENRTCWATCSKSTYPKEFRQSQGERPNVEVA